MIVNHFDTNRTARRSEERHELLNRKKAISEDYMEFGYDYFDNNNIGVGYGGYKYDGRYAKGVSNVIDFYDLKKGDRVLEIGCAKGFILVEFYKQGIEVVGWDKSHYAIENSHPEVKEYIRYAENSYLPFENNTFDFILGKEVLPHIQIEELTILIKECMRVGKNNIFFEIQCGRNKKEIEDLMKWDETHKVLETPEWWDVFLDKLGYKGDLNYKILMLE